MKKLLEWIEQQTLEYGNSVLLLVALILFSALALILAMVYAIFIAIMYIDPYAILVVTFVLLILIIYRNRLPS